jgi:hypothetical protein
MDTIVPATSSNLGAPALGAAIITLPSENSELGALWRRYDARPVRLLRTREGRALSLDRYQRAGEFMGSLASPMADDTAYLFYSAGIVAQLAMSSHLLDVGFPTRGVQNTSASMSIVPWPTPMPLASAARTRKPSG